MFHSLSFFNINYTGFLVYILIALVILVILQFMSIFVKAILNVKSNFYTEILSIYECGFDPFFFNLSGEFNVIFYRVSILFLLFDLELVLFFPWVLTYLNFGFISIVAVLCFVILLFWGFFYEWNNNVLDW